MDASCKVQKSIHVFQLVHKSMCPGFWVHIKRTVPFYLDFYFTCDILKSRNLKESEVVLMFVNRIVTANEYSMTTSVYAH